MENKYEEEGIALGEIFSVMFGRKLVLLISTLGLFLVGLLFVLVIYNPKKELLTSEYTYKMTSLNESKLFDGSSFSFKEILTDDNLNKVKASDESFKNIDIKEILESEAITIKQEETTSNGVTTLGNYTVTIRVSSFDSKELARKFAEAVINVPNTLNKEIYNNVKHDSNLRLFSQANTYEMQIDYLNEQLNAIVNLYNYLIETYGNVVYSDNNNNNNLSVYKQNVLSYFEATEEVGVKLQMGSTALLKNKVNEQGLIKDEAYSKLVLSVELDNQKKISKDADAKLSELKLQLNGITNNNYIVMEELSKQIATLSVAKAEADIRIAEVEQKINNLNNTSDVYKKSKKELEDSLALYAGELQAMTDLVSNAEKDILNKNSTVLYSTPRQFTTTGTISPVIAVVATIVVGFGIGCVINLVVDRKKLSQEYLIAKRLENKKKINEVINSNK